MIGAANIPARRTTLVNFDARLFYVALGGCVLDPHLCAMAFASLSILLDQSTLPSVLDSLRLLSNIAFHIDSAWEKAELGNSYGCLASLCLDFSWFC